MGQVARDTAAAAGSGTAAGSAAPAALAPRQDRARYVGRDDRIAAAAASAGSGASAPAAEAMSHRAGMCPSTVLGATTKAAVKGKAVVLTIESSDRDAIASIRKRTDELLAEKRDAPSGSATT